MYLSMTRCGFVAEIAICSKSTYILPTICAPPVFMVTQHALNNTDYNAVNLSDLVTSAGAADQCDSY